MSLPYHFPPVQILLIDSIFFIAVVMLAKFCRRVTAIYIVFALPGTCAHEVAHFLVALFTNGRPRFPSIIPIRTHDGWLLGSVQLGNARWYNAAVIAFAPLALIPLAGWLYVHRIAAISPWSAQHWLYLYLIIVMSMSALPSRIDLRLAWKYSAGVIFVAGAALIVYLIMLLRL